MVTEIFIESEIIKLSQFLKWTGTCETGGQAKETILSGIVKVNQRVEIRPGRQLRNGDIVKLNKQKFKVVYQNH